MTSYRSGLTRSVFLFINICEDNLIVVIFTFYYKEMFHQLIEMGTKLDLTCRLKLDHTKGNPFLKQKIIYFFP